MFESGAKYRQHIAFGKQCLLSLFESLTVLSPIYSAIYWALNTVLVKAASVIPALDFDIFFLNS